MRYLSLVILLCSLSACRFGNHSDAVKAPTNFTSTQLITTQAVKFEAYAYFNDDSNTENKSVSLAAIPQRLLTNFSNPLYLAQPKAQPGIFMFIGITQSDCMQNPLQSGCIEAYDAGGNYFELPSDMSTPQQFGDNPNCKMSIGTPMIAYLDKTQTTVFQFSDGTKEASAGNLLMDYTFRRDFQNDSPGACASILTKLAGCYQDGTGCTSDELAYAYLLFDLYVKQAGILDLSNAAQIKSLEYIVRFR